MNRKSALILSGVLGTFFSTSAIAALNCTASPDCASLGYTMTAADCTDGIKVACPTDPTKVFCKAGVQPATCAVGSILGNDQLCYSPGTGTPDGVKPVGIVFDTTNKLAVALTDINSSGSAGSSTMIWSANYYDIPALGNCTSSRDTTCGADGRANTTAILNCGSSCGTTPAATATNSYEPSGCSKDFCKKTKWFLPSMRDLITLYNAKSYVNASLSLTASSGATTLTESYYWSSTEYDNYDAWKLRMSDCSRYSSIKYYITNLYVRPVVKY